MRKVAALACVAALAAGCGAEDRKGSGAPAPRDDSRPAEPVPTKRTKTEREARSGTAYAVIGAQGNEDPRPFAELYSVFSRPATARDRSFADEIANYAEGCGEPLPDKARVLVSGVGESGSDLVAVPTSKGLMAYALLPMGGGGCGRPFAGGLMMAGQIMSDAVVNYGLVPDDVESVEVVVNGVARTAWLGENGFAIEIKGAPRDIDLEQPPGIVGRLLVHRRDGTTQEF
jgi:hypothetical protein